VAAPQNAVADSEAGANQSNHLISRKRGATGVAPPRNGSEATAVAFLSRPYPVSETLIPARRQWTEAGPPI
jgi:hypothetical protein